MINDAMRGAKLNDIEVSYLLATVYLRSFSCWSCSAESADRKRKEKKKAHLTFKKRVPYSAALQNSSLLVWYFPAPGLSCLSDRQQLVSVSVFWCPSGLSSRLSFLQFFFTDILRFWRHRWFNALHVCQRFNTHQWEKHWHQGWVFWPPWG